MSERKFMASGHGGSSLSSTGDGSRDSDGQDGGHGRNSEGGGSGEKDSAPPPEGDPKKV